MQLQNRNYIWNVHLNINADVSNKDVCNSSHWENVGFVPISHRNINTYLQTAEIV